jgi:hypothetical protein
LGVNSAAEYQVDSSWEVVEAQLLLFVGVVPTLKELVQRADLFYDLIMRIPLVVLDLAEEVFQLAGVPVFYGKPEVPQTHLLVEPFVEVLDLVLPSYLRMQL